MTFVHENVNTDEKATAESKANFFIEIIPPKIKLQKYPIMKMTFFCKNVIFDKLLIYQL